MILAVVSPLFPHHRMITPRKCDQARSCEEEEQEDKVEGAENNQQIKVQRYQNRCKSRKYFYKTQTREVSPSSTFLTTQWVFKEGQIEKDLKFCQTRVS